MYPSALNIWLEKIYFLGEVDIFNRFNMVIKRVFIAFLDMLHSERIPNGLQN
jgi:hypothetical protein